MGIKNERREIKNIYKNINSVAKLHNERPDAISTFDTITLHPFKSMIKGGVISTNRGDDIEYFGFTILLDKIEEHLKSICISFTPLKITNNFWDNDQKDLIRNLAVKFNSSHELFKNIKGVLPKENYTTANIYTRIDKIYGLQLYCNYQYDTLNFPEFFYNFCNISSYADNCSLAIHDMFKLMV